MTMPNNNEPPGSQNTSKFSIPWHVTNDYYRRFGLTLAPINLVFHASLTLFFAAINVWVLFSSYLAGFIIRLWILRSRAKVRDYSRVMILLWTLNLVQSFIATIFLGTASGFHFYILTLLPATLITENSRLTKALQTLIYTAFFIYCDSWISQWQPRQPLPEEMTSMLRIFNISMSCLMIAGISYTNTRINREARETFHRLASVDAMTGLLNRRYMSETISQQLSRSRRHERPMTLLISDIDHFKLLNDKYGHAAGDQVLSHIANLFQATVREYDDVSRWGGEEFLVLFPDTDLQTALGIAERVQSVIENTSILYEKNIIGISVTMGVAEVLPDENWQATVARADAALYRGKRAGRNRIEIAT